MVSFTRFVDGLFLCFFLFGEEGEGWMFISNIVDAIVIGEELASDEGTGWVKFALGEKVTSLSNVERL